MKSFFLLLICLAAGFEQNELPLKTYIAFDDSIAADSIMPEQFKPCEYANVFSEKGTVWLETDLPTNISSNDREVLYFTPEVFFKDYTGHWLFIGRTGSGVPRQKKSLGARYNAISLIPVLKKRAAEYRELAVVPTGRPITLRIRLKASRPAPIGAFVMSFNKFTLAGELITFYISVAFSACIIALVYVFFNSLLFKERGSIFFALIFGFLAVHIFIANGICFGRILNTPSLNHYLYKANYIFICLIIICVIIILQKINLPVRHNFSPVIRTAFDMIPIINTVIISIGILYFILNIPDRLGTPIIFSAMFIALAVFTAQTNFTMLYNPTVQSKICINMLISVYMLAVQQFFHLLRFSFRALTRHGIAYIHTRKNKKQPCFFTDKYGIRKATNRRVFKTQLRVFKSFANAVESAPAFFIGFYAARKKYGFRNFCANKGKYRIFSINNKRAVSSCIL